MWQMNKSEPQGDKAEITTFFTLGWVLTAIKSLFPPPF